MYNNIAAKFQIDHGDYILSTNIVKQVVNNGRSSVNPQGTVVRRDSVATSCNYHIARATRVSNNSFGVSGLSLASMTHTRTVRNGTVCFINSWSSFTFTGCDILCFQPVATVHGTQCIPKNDQSHVYTLSGYAVAQNGTLLQFALRWEM